MVRGLCAEPKLRIRNRPSRLRTSRLGPVAAGGAVDTGLRPFVPSGACCGQIVGDPNTTPTSNATPTRPQHDPNMTPALRGPKSKEAHRGPKHGPEAPKRPQRPPIDPHRTQRGPKGARFPPCAADGVPMCHCSFMGQSVSSQTMERQAGARSRAAQARGTQSPSTRSQHGRNESSLVSGRYAPGFVPCCAPVLPGPRSASAEALLMTRPPFLLGGAPRVSSCCSARERDGWRESIAGVGFDHFLVALDYARARFEEPQGCSGRLCILFETISDGAEWFRPTSLQGYSSMLWVDQLSTGFNRCSDGCGQL